MIREWTRCRGMKFRETSRARLQGCILREVERSHGGFVGMFIDNGYKARWRIIPLSDWRKWAATATVIRKAEDAE